MALSAERPGWVEVVGIVSACLVLLVVLVEVDRAAYEREMARARAVLAERARDAGRRAEVTPAPAAGRPVAPPRSPETGGDRPLAVPVGGAWSAGTSTAIAHARSRDAAAGPAPALRRIVGPTVAASTEGLPASRPAAGVARGRPAAAPPVEPTGRPRQETARPRPARPGPRTAAQDPPARRRSGSAITPAAAARPWHDGDRLALLLVAAAGTLMALSGAVVLHRGR